MGKAGLFTEALGGSLAFDSGVPLEILSPGKE